MSVKISNEKPPKHIYDKAVELWNVDFEAGTVFTYGDTIHIHGDISPDLLVHESHHTLQQKKYVGGPDAWWDRYFRDEEFRKEQELECYQRQYQFIQEKIKDRNDRARYLWAYASHLSGEMYGRVLKFNEALKLIKQ